MDKDRKAICKIISDMFESRDENGIYQTSTAYTRLEHYIEQQRIEAVGWMHAESCVLLDRGDDPRTTEVPEILEKAQTDLSL